jgi:hypothetical protein
LGISGPFFHPGYHHPKTGKEADSECTAFCSLYCPTRHRRKEEPLFRKTAMGRTAGQILDMTFHDHKLIQAENYAT